MNNSLVDAAVKSLAPTFVDQVDFRHAMAQVPTAVYIITTNGPAGIAGFTASSVTSVSAEPPTMLVCINKNNSRIGAFQKNSGFSINLLRSGDQELANCFSGTTKNASRDRFEMGDWDRFPSGYPYLKHSVFSFECHLKVAREVGTHFMLLGEVHNIWRQFPDDSRVLLYHQREYFSVYGLRLLGLTHH